MAISLANTKFFQADAFNEEVLNGLIEQIKPDVVIEKFDIVMSDMAPKTSGIRLQDQQRSYQLCLRAFDVAQVRLRKNGHFIVKFFG